MNPTVGVMFQTLMVAVGGGSVAVAVLKMGKAAKEMDKRHMTIVAVLLKLLVLMIPSWFVVCFSMF